MKNPEIQCSYCPNKGCFHGDLSKAPAFCPTLTRTEVLEEAKHKLEET